MNISTAAAEAPADGADNLTAGQRIWLEHIRRCEKQGLKFSAYCAREGLSTTALYAVRKVLRAKGAIADVPSACSAPRFASVQLSHAAASLTLEALLPNNVQVRVSGSDASQLSAVLSTLARL